MNIEFKHTKIMKKNWLYIVCFACMATACSGTPQTVNERLCSVDVASAMENLTELKLSELGKDVRYVALETTDSCLIGAGPDILLLDKYIVVFPIKIVLSLIRQTDGSSAR